MRDTLLAEARDRMRRYGESRHPQWLLDRGAGQVVRRLERLDGVLRDADVLTVLAEFGVLRSSVLKGGRKADDEWRRAMQWYAALFLVDHRRVPEPLWPDLTAATGFDPRDDPRTRALLDVRALLDRFDTTGDGEAGTASSGRMDALIEAAQVLRQAVDAETDRTGRAAHLSALARVTRLRLEWEEPDDPAETPPEAAPGAGEPSAPGPDGAAQAQAQADAIVATAVDLVNRVISEERALERASDIGREVTEHAVIALMDAAHRLLSDGDSRVALPIVRLTLEAAGVRWGARRGTWWWTLADLYVETSRFFLGQFPDGTRFRSACTVVDDQIAKLRAESPRDDEELALTLYASALLRSTPYLEHMTAIAAEDAQQAWRERLRRARFRLGDGLAEMPLPAGPLQVALTQLREAETLTTGHTKGRILVAQARVLPALGLLSGESDGRQQLRAVREAFDLLNPRLDPIGRINLLRLLAHFGEVELPASADRLCAEPLHLLGERLGRRDAETLHADALALAAETARPDLQRQIWRDRDLPSPTSPDSRRRRWDTEVHALPGNRVACAQAKGAAKAVRSRAHAERWPASELAVTLLHLAVHTDGAEAGQGEELIEEAARIWPDLTAQYPGLRWYHSARLAEQAAKSKLDDGDLIGAATAAGSAIRQYGFAADSAAAADAIDLAMAVVLTAGEARIDHVAGLLVPGVACLHAVTAEIGFKIHELCLLMSLRLGSRRSVAYDVVFLLHQAAKGVDTTVAQLDSGPLTLSSGLERSLLRAGAVERTGPARPWQDETFDMLAYAGAGEAEPEAADAERLNRLRLADEWITGELMTSRRPGGVPLLFLDQVQPLIPGDTVILSIYLGATDAAEDGQTPRASLSCLAISRDWVELHTIRISDVEAGIVRASQDQHVIMFHPVASEVSDIRAGIQDDPLHRPVSRAARRLLTEVGDTYLGRFGQRLGEWSRQGKTHLCVWPHGPLHYLPFHLFETEGEPIADGWTITQICGLNPLRRSLGGPITRTTPPARTRHLVVFGSAEGGSRHGLQAEPGLEIHAAEVGRALTGEVLIGAAATPGAFLTLAPTARYVHVAAHGSHNAAAPWFQCLFLTPGPDDDGRLFAHDILRADLRNVELVTLSSCESALGRFDINDNLRGLPAALFAAGVPAIVGCLWPVRPEAATFFFATLYRCLAEHDDRRAAFRTAQIATRRRHPAYQDWGAFGFMGDWRTSNAPGETTR
ncbi:CHAT domain-containing protein [Actinomadura sp. ATCC 39365]